LVVTDSLFSMDGDLADLAALAGLRARYGFLLAVDEAHATLVCGERGGGAAEQFGVADQVGRLRCRRRHGGGGCLQLPLPLPCEGVQWAPARLQQPWVVGAAQVDVHIGTLSKAFGCLGGFVACSSRLRSLLLNKGRNVVFSTALPAPVVGAALAALKAGQLEGWRRRHLHALQRRVAQALGVVVTSPIVPLVVGSNEEALRLSGELLARGFHVPAIRPPTVPVGTARLRLSLSAAHSLQDVDDLVAALKACGARFLALDQAQRPAAQGPAPAGSKL
jgi:8-amino-7-oxononanoate synthase